MSKKLILFGAGKIGRSFIGRLFSLSGYEVVFVDIDTIIIASLNRTGKYRVVIKNDEEEKVTWVEHVRGIMVSDTEKVVEEIVSADILATAVGQKILPKIAPVIAEGLIRRAEQFPDYPLDIILAENLRDAAFIFKKELQKYLPDFNHFEQYVGLVETSIGKMVPIMPKSETEKDPLLVYAEPYDILILDKKAFKNPIPKVAGLAPKENMSAWVDRKLFIHNLGHAAAVYYGNAVYPDLVYLYELMEQTDVYETTRSAMIQAADILMRQHPGEFSEDALTEHIDDLLHRFSNKALGDTVYRVGQDLYRKLGPEDRLVGVLKLAVKNNMPYDKILFIISCAPEFSARDEFGNISENDVKFSIDAEKGISYVLETVCKLPVDEYFEIHQKARELIKNRTSDFLLRTSD